MFWVACLAVVPTAFARDPAPDAAASLRARYSELTGVLAASSIQPGLHVESVDDSRRPRGDAWAVIDQPFGTVVSAFATPSVLCEALILHLNVHYCRPNGRGERPGMALSLGKKTQQPLEDTFHIQLDLHTERAGDDFLRLQLSADEGPLGTRDYQIHLELVALDERRSFLHLRYSYTQTMLSRAATGVYFATNGRDKVGFTRVSEGAGGETRLVRGTRGVLERNTLRYYMAFSAWLHSMHAPTPEQRFEAGLERWFADTERFALQLREVTHDEYIAMKRAQYRRQQEAVSQLASR